MIDKIYKLFLDELAFFNSSSHFAHQKMKNPKDCGGLVEIAIRKFLKEVMGSRFKVTHGYIYSAAHKELSPQLDIIIVDTLVPHTLKRFEYLDGLEVVSMESVVGIFEVKRTLTKKIIIEAAEHLKKTIEFIPITKNNITRYLPGGTQLIKPLDGGSFSNPMIGIIGLTHNKTINNVENLSAYTFLDIIYSVDGYLISTQAPDKLDSFKVLSCRNANELINYNAIKFDKKKPENPSKEQILKMAIGCLINYLSETSGRIFKMSDYFTINLTDE